LAGSARGDSRERAWNEREKVPERVSMGYQDHHRELRIGEILLKLKAPVGGKEDLKTPTRRASKKLAVP
jgi:hypothetical protein